jgi:glycosyltransferase involved in cell wall biosynthesis
MNHPRISVIIPVYNQAEYLSEAIDSVLGQSLPAHEILVVDDGSTDRPEEGIAKYDKKVRLLRQENQGAGVARNLGIRNASGEYLAFLDADDLWSLDKLRNQMDLFRGEPAPDLVFGMLRQFLSSDLSDELREKLHCPDETAPGYVPGAMLVSRETFMKVGFFPTQVRVGEFVDWYARAREAGLRTAVLPEVVYHRRIHSKNQGIRAKHRRNEYLHVLKSALDRRRGQSS